MKLIVNLFLSLNLLFIASSVHADVKASLNQSEVFQGDPVMLTIQSDQNNKEQPDLGPLLNNFDLKGTSTSSQINIINGSRSFKKTWSIELQPKLSGEVVIPAISLGNDKTAPLSVTVKKLPPEVAAETSKHIFIESSVESAGETYVQQQIPYTVKLFYDSSMQTGEVFSPQIENANIRALGNDKKYQVVRAGKKYMVVEKRFVISPEKSGVLHIPPTSVKGRIALSGGDSQQLRKRMDDSDMLNQFFNGFKNDPFFNSPFDEFFSRRSIGPTRPFSVSSEAVDVDVLPVPASFKGSAWLPAEDLIMTDSWSTQPPELKVGEPVTRKLILQVKGLASSQIPEIEIPRPEGMKVYPEQAKTETPNDGNTIYGIQHIDISYIPNNQGKVTIPEINIDWWDIKQKKQQTFTLPEWNLNVAAGAPGSNLSLNKEEAAASKQAAAPEKPVAEQLESSSSYWGWKILAALILLIIILFAIYNGMKKRYGKLTVSNEHAKEPVPELINIEAVKASLLKACKDNDKYVTARLLIKLVKTQWNDQSIQNLGTLAANLNHGSPIIKELDQKLYATGAGDWDGGKLHELVVKGLHKKQYSHQKAPHNGLAPLYPV